MTAATHRHEPAAIGYLDGVAVPRARLDERLDRLRSGTRAALLPVPGSAEDRQLARWVAQVIVTEELCRAEANRLGLEMDAAEPGSGETCMITARRGQPRLLAAELGAAELGAAGLGAAGLGAGELGAAELGAAELGAAELGAAELGAAGLGAAVELGSIVAAAWANDAAVRALFVRITAAVEVDEAEVRAYWEVTASVAEAQWLLRHRLGDGPTQPLGPVGADALPAAIAAALDQAPIGAQFEVIDAIGRHTVIVDARVPAREPDYAQNAPRIREQLLASARRAAFVRWLDAARAARVVTVAGLEHPGDPHQPDNHHKH